MRKIELPGGGAEIILVDTVGFISDLPTELVAAFRATLEEVLEADLICHVRDISHPETEEQSRDVATIMESLGVLESTPQIEVWNKIDRLDPDARAAVLTRADRAEDVLAISSITGEGIEALTEAITEALAGTTYEDVLNLSFADGRQRAWLYERGLVEAEEQGEDGYALSVRWNAMQKAQFEGL